MIIIILLLLLLLSFFIHITSVLLYAVNRKKKYFSIFVNTAVTNIGVAGGITFLVAYKPSLISGIDLNLLLWLISGLVMVIMLCIKIFLARKMYRSIKDPKNFHYNFFGKKVLHRDDIILEGYHERGHISRGIFDRESRTLSLHTIIQYTRYYEIPVKNVW